MTKYRGFSRAQGLAGQQHLPSIHCAEGYRKHKTACVDPRVVLLQRELNIMGPLALDTYTFFPTPPLVFASSVTVWAPVLPALQSTALIVRVQVKEAKKHFAGIQINSA